MAENTKNGLRFLKMFLEFSGNRPDSVVIVDTDAPLELDHFTSL
jgi:hypothetical protein